MRKILSPIVHHDSYTRAVEVEINRYFAEVIFGPLVDMLEEAGIVPDEKDQERQNASDAPLKRAITEGRIWYADGEFTGQFSAATSRELRRIGATWNPGKKTFHLEQSKVPFDLRNFIFESKQKSTALHKRVADTITEMEKNIAQAATGIEYAGAADKIIGDLQKQFMRTVKGLDMVSVEAQINPGVRQALTKKLTNNANLAIKDFAAEKLPELRSRVEMNVLAGGRADKLAKIIEVEYGVSKRKAAFIAGQETSLLLSKYREERAKDIGSTSYVWRARHDSVTRPDHADLDGTVQYWDNPPITDKAAGRRCNPGCDYNCRCSASPIVNYIPALPVEEPALK